MRKFLPVYAEWRECCCVVGLIQGCIVCGLLRATALLRSALTAVVVVVVLSSKVRRMN